MVCPSFSLFSSPLSIIGYGDIYSGRRFCLSALRPIVETTWRRPRSLERCRKKDETIFWSFVWSPARPTYATTVADERVTHGCAVLCVEGFSNCEKDNSKLMLGVSKYAFMLVMIPINASEQLTVAGVFISPLLMYIWSSDQGCKKLIYIVWGSFPVLVHHIQPEAPKQTATPAAEHVHLGWKSVASGGMSPSVMKLLRFHKSNKIHINPI